jgi:hypothetical protein
MEKHLTESAMRRCRRAQVIPVWVFLFTLLASIVTIAAADRENSTTPAVLSKEERPLTEYRALRRMHAKSEKFNQEGWLDAWTELDERGFRYEILSERGADTVRNKVLKAVLKREQELIAEGQTERAALTEDNYEFTDGGMEEGLRYVLLKPKRKEVMLVEGRMVLSPDGSDLLRVEGRLAKNPSFWTSLVDIIRHFANIDGVRVPVSTESIAKIKFAGHSRLDVFYEYESINGRPVTKDVRRTLAAAHRSPLSPE